MIKPLKVLLFTSLSTLILSACSSNVSTNGTSPSNNNSSVSQAPSTDKTNNQGNEGSTPSNVGTQENTTQQTPSEGDTNKSANNLSSGKEGAKQESTKSAEKSSTAAPTKEKSITLDEKGTKHATATLFESSQLPLYIYLLPGYEASKGVSNDELTVTSKNKKIKMTVSPLKQGQSMEESKQQAMDDMQKINKQVQEITTLKKDKFFEDATVLYAENAKEVESAYFLTVDGFPLKVTIDRPAKTSAVLPYLQAMIKTLGVKQAN